MNAPEDENRIVRRLAEGRKPRGVPWRLRLAMLFTDAWPVGALLGALWVVGLAQFVAERMIGWQAVAIYACVYPPAFKAGVWWTPLTHQFLHGGLFHILMNSSALAALGPALSFRFGVDLKGAALFWLFFVLSGVAGGLTFLALQWGGAMPMLGASGAICGLWGALARLDREGAIVPIWSSGVGVQVRSFVIMNLILAVLGFGLGMLSGQGGVLVAWEAHLGGFVFGLLFAPLLPVRYPWRDMVRAQPERP